MTKKRTEIKPEFVGISAVNSFIANVSSPRAVMDANHFSAHLPLLNPETKFILSGIEFELAKYIDHVKSPDSDCVAKGIIPMYIELGLDKVPSFTVFVEYEENDKIWLDYIEIPKYIVNHSFFGYPLGISEALMSLTYNSIIPKETILAKAKSYNEKKHTYDFGVKANVAFMSVPGVAEDGFVVSRSFVEKLKFTSILKRDIYISQDVIPINLYGDDTKFKFIPDIGEMVEEDGLLCALRPRKDFFSISDLNNRNIREPDMTFDLLTYVNPNSKVIDIRVYRGNYHKKEHTDPITEQLDFYAELYRKYIKRVISTYENYKKEVKIRFGKDDAISLTPQMHRFISDCYIKETIFNNTKAYKLSYRKQPIDQYRVEITTMNVITPNIGYKLTDLHAAKGVICRILPDKMMPVDKNGNKADIITDSVATISRMNLGRSYETYMGSVTRDNRHYIINYINQNNIQLENISDKDLTYLYNYLRGLYALINSDMVEFLDSLDRVGLINHIKEIVEDDMYIYYPTDNENNIIDVIEAIENSIYKPTNDKVTYVDDFGNRVETKENIRIGRLYIMLLEKIANSYSAVSSAKVNPFGFPIKGSSHNKTRAPHSLSPVKTLGETETRIITSYTPPETIAELFDINLNPISHKLVVKSILESDKAFDNMISIDRAKVELGNTRSLSILRHVFNAVGFDLDYVEDSNED